MCQAASFYKEGFLTKCGDSVKTWKKRWFVLKVTEDSATLSYYRTRGVCKLFFFLLLLSSLNALTPSSIPLSIGFATSGRARHEDRCRATTSARPEAERFRDHDSDASLHHVCRPPDTEAAVDGAVAAGYRIREYQR